MSKEAWFCPACQKHHAPHVDTCPGAPITLNPFTPNPHINLPMPSTAYQFDPCALCKGACGNVACPKLAVISGGAYSVGTRFGEPDISNWRPH